MRMKKTIIVSIVGFLLFMIPIHVDASFWTGFILGGDDDADDIEDEEVMDAPDSEEQGGVEVESERFPYESFQVNNEAEDQTILGVVVSLANMVMTFNAYIVHGVDTILNELFTLNPIERFSGMVNMVSQSIYETLQDHFGQLFFIFAIGYMVYLVATKGTFREAIRRGVMFVLVLVFAGFWMLNSGFFMQTFNSLSLDAQGYLIDAGGLMVANAGGSGVFSEGVNIDRDDPMDGTIAMMRNVYFDLGLKRPYLIVNYNETSEQDVTNSDVSDTDVLDGYGGSDYDRYERMLAFDQTSGGQALKQDYLEGVEVEPDELGNSSMGAGAVYTQLGQTVVGFFVALFLAVPFGALGLLNFLLQLMALGLAFFLPFALMISYIPHFANSGFNVFMKLLTVFLVKAMLGIVIMFVYTLTFVVDTMIPPDTFGMYLANVAVLITLLFVLMWKRDAIIKLVTAGRVQSLDKNVMNNVNESMVNPAMDKVAKGASMVHPTAGAALNKLNQAKDGAVRQTTLGSPSQRRTTTETSNQENRKEQRKPQSDQNKDASPEPSDSGGSNQTDESKPLTRKEQKKMDKKNKKEKKSKKDKNNGQGNKPVTNDDNRDNKEGRPSSKEKENKRKNNKNVVPLSSNARNKEEDTNRSRQGVKENKKEKRMSKPMGENDHRKNEERQPQEKK